MAANISVLIDLSLPCQIGDFGMARDLMQDESNYYTSSGGIIPIKWTAPEVLLLLILFYFLFYFKY